MAIIIPEGAGLAALEFRLSGSTEAFITTIGFLTADPGDPEAAAEGIYDAWTAAGAPCTAGAMLTGYSFVGVKVTQTINGEPELGNKLTTVNGTTAMPPLPPNCAFLVTKNTTRGGRKGKGRMYLPPCFQIGEDSVSATGVLSLSFQGALQANLDAAYTNMVTNGYSPALLHEDGGTGNLITSLTLASLIATQRRRLR